MSNSINSSKNTIIKEKGFIEQSSVSNFNNMLIDTKNNQNLTASPTIDLRIVPEEHFMNSNDHLAKNITKSQNSHSSQEEEYEIDEEIEDHMIDSRFKDIYNTSRHNNKTDESNS